MADEQLHQANKFWNEENEGEDEETKERVTNDFANYVPIEDAHGANGQCNMGESLEVVEGLEFALCFLFEVVGGGPGER
ncbi:MAG TPA: hypothetical protein VL128_13575 [Candidatus Eisenbacteria bacterium]|nr:hypothetical protein [Candidatus Eisenbacteria bacterium]